MVELKKLGLQMLNELYKHATPSSTWNSVVKKYSGKHEPFYQNFYLSKEKSEKILDKYKKKCRNKFESDSIAMLWLDFAPTQAINKKEKAVEK
jgi:hypothetical protein